MKSLPFSKLAEVFEELEKTSSGNEMRRILCEFFKKVPTEEIEVVAYLCLGSIASEYEDINIGMAEKMVLKSIAIASGRAEKEVLRVFKQKGDIGLAAELLCGKPLKTLVELKKEELTVWEVFEKLRMIAGASGEGSQERKIKLLAELLRNAKGKEARYLSRLVLGTMRLGVGDKTVLDALAMAFGKGKEDKPAIEHAYNICPDVGIIAKTIATKGIKGIERIDVVLGRPIQMMLAQRVKAITEIIENMPEGKIAAEEKYDGERIQVHKKGDKIVLFSRRLENITSQFPDVVEQIKKNIKSKECIIEGEVVPVDEKGNLLPFQVLMQRRRKYGVEEYVKKIPTCFYLFDILYSEGRSFIRKPYPERHEELKRITRETPNLQLAKRVICEDVDCLEEFFNKSLERGCEGIVAKSCAKESVYQAGTRGWLWIKWKREYAKEMADTFDLVVVGAFMGRGKRAGTYGALLCAAYNDSFDRFESFCKLGSGFTDEELSKLPKKLKPYEVPHKPARVEVTKLMEPDKWFEPKLVVEVLGAEITRSPAHTTALEKGQGLALRFPRFVRWREEKKPEQATTVKEILEIFKKK